MNPILFVYLVVVALLALVSVGIVLSLIRYRFRGDLTLVFAWALFILFAADTVITLYLLLLAQPTSFQ